MRIHALTVDRGGCFHYRIRQPLTALRSFGHVTSFGSGIDAETFDAADVLVTQYINMGSSIDQWVKWCDSADKFCVWDADDDIFQTQQVLAKGTAYDDPETVKRMARGISASHAVTVTTPALAEIYSRYNDNVVILPNCVPDWLLWRDMPDEGDEFSIVYTCGPSHTRDIQELAPTLARFMQRRPDTHLKFYGPRDRPIGVPDWWRISTFDWVKQTDEYLRLISGTVGIAPLADMPFNYGKSGIKAQEYQALGIVPVVQDFPQYREVVRHGATGFLCQTPGDWIDAFRTLSSNRPLRRRMAEEARRHAHSFAMSQWAPQWENLYAKGARS